jgi:hypothetical protein
MIDIDDTLRSELHRLVPIDSRRDWDEVAARAGLKRGLIRRRWAIGAAVVAMAAAIGAFSPLGAAIVGTIDDFSAWLTGAPGAPASESAQQAFDEANARSWLGFPQGTKLRHLISAKTGDNSIDLLGFRSGSGLCLRVTVTGGAPATHMNCAPLAELRRAGGPARVVITDFGVGKGDKVAWYGIDRYNSSDLQITAGIATDAVSSVLLEDDAGRHEVKAASNAFLYVAEQPDVGQRVKRVWARTDGGLTAVPFAPIPFGVGFDSGAAAPAAPAIEHHVSGGRIGWLEDHENRGEPLDVLPARMRSDALRERNGQTNVLFGRVLTPDPDRPIRMIVTLNAHRPDGPAAGLCTLLATRGGAGGGCASYPGVFEESPISSGLMGGGSSAFVSVSGIASDDVTQIKALLADGQLAEVPLKDNAFVVDLPRANLPARLVSYDAEERVIGVSQPWQDFGRPSGGPARGRATSLLRVSGPGGATAELFIGPSTDGGECAYVKEFVDSQHRGMSTGCNGPAWTGPALQLGMSFPPHFINGRVRPDVKKVRIRFADGSATTLTPTRGYILWATPKEHFEAANGALEAEGLSADGTVLAHQSFMPPGR